MVERAQVINFGAGPSALPDEVLNDAIPALLNFAGTGIGITEISHRSKEFGTVVDELEQLIRAQLDVPHTHKIIFMQGGGTAQFAATVLNMLARDITRRPEVRDGQRKMDYVLTGSWSRKAAEEARRLIGASQVHIAADSRQHKTADGRASLPPPDAYAFSEDPALVYYCENETVDGVQFAGEAGTPTSFPFDRVPRAKDGSLPPLVADYSSSFLSRRIPRIEDHAVIFAGAQKNLGPAGLTVVIVREDVLVDVDAAVASGAVSGSGALRVPLVLSYKTHTDAKSLYNTPPTFAIYVAMLVMRRAAARGGLPAVEAENTRKQAKLYGALKEAEAAGVLSLGVREGSRSWMNVVFRGKDADVEKAFLEAGDKKGFKAMKGHR